MPKMKIELDNIYNMDCLEGMKHIPDGSVDCVVTDCPYLIIGGGCSESTYRTKKGNRQPSGIMNRQRDTKHVNLSGMLNDSADDVRAGKMFEYNSIQFKEWLPDVYRVLKEGTHCYIMINSRNLKELQEEAEKVGFRFQNLLAWKKNSCLGGSTQIFIRNKKSGLCYRSNLKDLYRNYTPNNKNDWQIMGDDSKWKDIINVFNNGRQEGVNITFRNGVKVFATHDHKFATKQGLKQVSELKIGDIVERSKNFETTWCKSNIDFELGFFVGLFLAEGCFDNNTLVFTLNRDRKDLGEKVEMMAKKYNAKCRKYESKKSHCDVYRVTSYILSGVISEYISGTNAKNKHLKREVFNADIMFMRGLYCGYINGDGHVETLNSGNTRLAIGFTYNKELEYDLRLLCDIIGVRMHAKVRQSNIGEKKYTSIAGHITDYSDSNKKDSGEIIAISKPCKQNVYDLQVSGNHLYSLVGGFITHNCTPNKYYMQCLEFILMLRKGAARNINDMGMTNCLSTPNIIGSKCHPTEKPISLMQVMIEQSTNKGDVVLDPFIGGG